MMLLPIAYLIAYTEVKISNSHINKQNGGPTSSVLFLPLPKTDQKKLFASTQLMG
jgi:hypothetical protein